MSVTLTGLIEQVSLLYKDCWHNGVTTATGVTNTAICAGLIGRGIPVGCRIQVSDADREIMAFDNATGTITFRPPHTSAIASETPFTITPLRWDTITAAIIRAVYSMSDSWMMQRATESVAALTGYSDTWDLPSDCHSVRRIEVRRIEAGADITTSSTWWEPFPHYSIISVDGVRKLKLSNPITGRIRIHYLALVTIPTDANEYIEFDANEGRDAVGFLVNRAASELFSSEALANPTSERSKTLIAMSDRYRAASEAFRANKMTMAGTSQKRFRSLPRHI